MTARTLFAAAALALGFALTLPGAPARADVDVDIGIGLGGGYVPAYDGYGEGGYGYGNGGYGGYPGRGYGRYHDGHGRPYYQQDDIYVTCRMGRQMLRDFGFYQVKAENCRGPNYVYTGWRKGSRYLLRMNTAGEVNRVRRID